MPYAGVVSSGPYAASRTGEESQDGAVPAGRVEPASSRIREESGTGERDPAAASVAATAARLRMRAAHCRAMVERAISCDVADELAAMAEDFEREAARLELDADTPTGTHA